MTDLMNERARKKALVVALLVAAVLTLAYLSYAFAQRQVTRSRRAAASGAKTITVKPGENFQEALEAAEPGDEIVLTAGASYSGNFVLPIKSGNAFITVRSSRCAEIPNGKRVSPAQEALTAKLLTPNVSPVLMAPVRSHHFKFECLTFSQGPGVGKWGYGLLQLGEGANYENQKTLSDVPHHFDLDRCIIRARDDQTALQRGVTLNSAHTTITNSYVSGIKWAGVETQAVGGWNGPGPFLIENNYLEAAGINILFGGAVTTIPGLVPSDITIRNNHLYKPIAWKGVWTAKNLLELKNARNVNISGNVLENSWPDAQTGWAIILNALGEYGPASVVENVEFAQNIVRNVANGINLRGMETSDRAARMRRIRFANNLIESVGAFGGEGKVLQLLQGTEAVSFDHNTVVGRVSSVLLLDAAGAFKHDDLSFTNNVAPHGEYGVFGNEGFLGTAAFEKYSRRWRFARNVIAGADAKRYPSDNSYPPALDQGFFVDASRGNYRIMSQKFKGHATDGKDPGCDFAQLEAALAWYLSPAAN